MKKTVYIALLFLAYILPLGAFAQSSYIPVLTEYIRRSNIVANAEIVNKSELFITVPPSGSTWHNGFTRVKKAGRVSLEISDTTNACIPDTFSCTVIVELTMYDWDNNNEVNYDTLTVYYDKANGVKYKERDIVEYPDVYYLKMKVISISNAAVKPFLLLKSEVEQERYKEMTYAYTPSISSITYTSGDNSLKLAFNIPSQVSDVAVEYDVEWMFVEAYSSTGTLQGTSPAIPYNFRFNSTRVTLQKFTMEGSTPPLTPTLKISNIYDKGYLICRIRAVGKGGADYDQRVEGNWSLADNGTFTTGNHIYPVSIEHDLKLNWQYDCAYAEEGKRKESISYFDGSLRSRQSQSLVKSEATNYIIVQDVIYDYQGRAAIQTLPAPVQQPTLKFIAGSAAQLSGAEYTKAVFDQDITGNTCVTATPPFGSVAKSEAYYSGSNAWAAGSSETNFAKYVPIANGYPFVQTEFTPDNTGRVSRVSAPGQSHKLGSGRETKYTYVTPNQTELDMLFGTEVGYAEHYQKNTVKDANGQVSVSYLNASGKVIATALAGPEPVGMTPLDTGDIPQLTVNLMNTSNSKYENDALISSYTFEVTRTKDYEFLYSMNAAKYTPEICGTENICFDGVYNLTITLTNECGIEQLKGNGTTKPDSVIYRGIGDTTGSTACKVGTVIYSFATDPKLVTSSGFIKVRLAPGTYTITKSLEINQDTLNFYIEKYVEKNTTCKKLEDFEDEALANIDTSGCNISCEECNSRLGTYAAFRTRKLVEYGNSGLVISPPSADLEDKIQDEFDREKAFCDDLCDNDFNTCDAIEQLLIGDVTPGGQYALYTEDAITGDITITDDGYSFLKDNTSAPYSYRNGSNYTEFNDTNYFKIRIGGMLKKVKDLTPREFLEYYRPEWAKVMIRKHPEYCNLEKCRDAVGKQSFDFDHQMLTTETYDVAEENGYLNPFNDNEKDPSAFTYPIAPTTTGTLPIIDPMFTATGCASVGGREEMWERLRVYRTYTFTTDYLTNSEGEDILAEEFSGSTGTGKFWYYNTTVYAGRKCTAAPTKLCEVDGSGNFITPQVQIGTINPVLSGGLPTGKYKIQLPATTSPETYEFSMWDIPVMGYFCSHVTDNAKRLNHCVTTNRANIKTCPGVKDHFWKMFRALYLANKNYLTATGDYTTTANKCTCVTDVPGIKQRRIFPDAANGNILLQDPQVEPTETEINTAMANAATQLAAGCQAQCESYADYWMDKLAGCGLSTVGGASSQKNLVRLALIEVCKKGCDTDNPFGSSSVSPENSATATDSTFRRVLERFGVFNLKLCNDLLITMPMPYGHHYFSTDAPQMGDTCMCNGQYNNIAPGVVGDAPEPTDPACPCEAVMKNADMKVLMQLKPQADPQYKCKDCINCDKFAEVFEYFEAEYASLPIDSPQYRDLFTGYFNRKLSFNLSFEEYAQYAAECLGDSTSYSDSIFYRYRSFVQSVLAYNTVNTNEKQLVPHPLFLPLEQSMMASANHGLWIESQLREKNINRILTLASDINDAYTAYPPRYGAMYDKRQAGIAVTNLNALSAAWMMAPPPAPPTPTGNQTFLDQCGCDKILNLLEVYKSDPENDLDKFHEYVESETGYASDDDAMDKIVNRCLTTFTGGGGEWVSGSMGEDEDLPTWAPGAKWSKNAKHLFYISNQSYPIYIPNALSCITEDDIPDPDPEVVQTVNCQKVMGELYTLFNNTTMNAYFMANNSTTPFMEMLYNDPQKLATYVSSLNSVTGISNVPFNSYDLYHRISGCFPEVPCSEFKDAVSDFIEWQNTNALGTPFDVNISVKEQLFSSTYFTDFVHSLNSRFNVHPYYQTYNEALIRKAFKDCLEEFCPQFTPIISTYMEEREGDFPYGSNEIDLRQVLMSEDFINDIISQLNAASNTMPYLHFYDVATYEEDLSRCLQGFCSEFKVIVETFAGEQGFDPRVPFLEQLVASGKEEELYDLLNEEGNRSPYLAYFSDTNDIGRYLRDCAPEFPCDSFADMTTRFVIEYATQFSKLYQPIKEQLQSPARAALFNILLDRVNAEAALYPYSHIYDRTELLAKIDECFTPECCIMYKDFSWTQEFLNTLLSKYPPSPLNAFPTYTTLLTSTFWKVQKQANVFLAKNKHHYTKKKTLRYELEHISRKHLHAEIKNNGIDKEYFMDLNMTFDGLDSLEFSWMWVTNFSGMNIINAHTVGCDGEIEFTMSVTYMPYGDPGVTPKTKTSALCKMSAFPFIRKKECSFDGTIPTLCNRSILPKVEKESCTEELKRIAKLNALNNYNTYIREVKNKFREGYMAACKNASEQFKMKYYISEYHYTLYYYDQAGNLVATVPPEGVKFVTNESQINDIDNARNSGGTSSYNPDHSLISAYQYNSLNQLTYQQTPDAGATSFYYDELGRIVFSRNAKQIPVHLYSYTKYDGLGRIYEVGQLSNTSELSDPEDPLTIPGKMTQSAITTFLSTVAGYMEVTKTLYDDATAIALPLDNVRNRVVCSSYHPFGLGGYTHAAYYSYDIHGNVKKLIRHIDALDKPSTQIAQGYKTVDYGYDLISGKVNSVAYQEGEADQYIHEYLYDADNRIIEARSGDRYTTVEADAVYYYYPHGSLARTEIGAKKVQGIDYSFTVQGWIKAVNSTTLKADRDMGKDGSTATSGNLHKNIAQDVYGFSLHYFEGDYSPVISVAQSSSFISKTVGSGISSSVPDLYNGNIKMMVTAIGKFMETSVDPPMASAYTYDQLNRITQAEYYNNMDMTVNEFSGMDNPLTDYKNTFEYDANGNIKKQLRNGVSSSGTEMDDLQYVYDLEKKNRLLQVIDNSNNLNGYADDIKTQAANNYEYDAIGNLTKDVAEQIENIEWTATGKIKRITRTAISTRPDLEFEYTPEGYRAVKIVIPKLGEKHKKYTFYVRGAQGNILATYERFTNRIVDYDTLQYAAVNDSIIAASGLSIFAGFIDSTYSWSGGNNGFRDSLETAINSSVALQDSFLYAQNPLALLLADTSAYNAMISTYSTSLLLSQLNGIAYTYGTLGAQICECKGATTFKSQAVDDVLIREYFLRAIAYYSLSDFNTISTGLGCASLSSTANTSQFNSIISCLLAQSPGSVLGRINSISKYNTCSTLDNVFPYIQTQYGSSIFQDVMARFPDIKKIIAKSHNFSCTSASQTDIINALNAADHQYLWSRIIAGKSRAYLIAWYKVNAPHAFIAGVTLRQKAAVSGYQQVHNMYSSSGNGMAAYFAYVQKYFSYTFFDNLRLKFYNKSRAYSDSLNLNEWMIYGSSRIGTHLTNKNLVCIKFYADTTTDGQTTNPTYVASYEPAVNTAKGLVWRGIRQYELSNHLGNVLVVISDKKVWNCAGGYYTADVIQATDYSPFGAPLPDRVWDKRQVINNQFNTTTEGWTGFAGSPTVSNDNGRLKILATGTCTVQKQIVTIPGKVYELYIDIDKGNFGGFQVGIYESLTSGDLLNKLYTATVNGKHVIYFKAATSKMVIRLMPQTSGSGSQSAYVNFVRIKRVSDAAFARNFTFAQDLTVNSRTGNTPGLYNATGSIIFEDGFESGPSDNFETVIEQMTLLNDGNEEEDYRFGFNGQEKDNEIYGDGNVYDYGFRIYNPRLARFLSVDPLTSSYPWYTPYQFAGNKPIIAIDIDGLEEWIVIRVLNFQTKTVNSMIKYNPGHRGEGVQYNFSMVGQNGGGAISLGQITLPVFNNPADLKQSTQPRFYYDNKQDARNGQNRKIGVLGANGAAIAQGKFYNANNQYASVAYSYAMPSMSESYGTDVYTGSNFNAGAMAEFLMENPGLKATIEGYTDSKNTSEYNITLSQKRADNMKEAIVQKARESNKYTAAQITELTARITAIGKGEDAAKAANGDEVEDATYRTTKVTVSAQ